ncbi:MAG: ParB/RepB/Spo0J family partition protein [Dermatophilaceae bacterium]
MAGTPENAAADSSEDHVARWVHEKTQPDAPGTTDEGLRPVPGARYVEVPTDQILPNPRQPRTVFDEDEMSELVDSIREVGLLQPVVVRPIGATPSGDGAHAPQYELVMGERRWRACQLAGADTVPAIVKETPDDDLLRDALLENLHRSQLNPLDEAAAYQQLLEDFGCTQESLAVKIGRSRSQISNTVRLLRLPPGVARRVAAGVLSAGHARALLALDDLGAMERLAQRIVAEGLSVRSVEEIVAVSDDEGTSVPRRRREAATPDERLERIAARMSDRLDTRVIVAMGRRRGKLTVEFADAEDLDRILALLDEAGAPVGG